MQTFSLHTLGCGSAKPSLFHNPSCAVINHRKTLYMIDCGEGSQKEFQRHGLKLSRLRHIFLTHLHGDHVLGLPGLIGTLGLLGMNGSLTIHTFADGKDILSRMLDYFCRDLPIDVNFNIIRFTDDVILETHALSVRTVRLRHRIPTVGFIFEEKEKLRHLNREAAERFNIPIAYYNLIKQGHDYVTPTGEIITNDILTTPADASLSYAHIGDTAFIPSLAPKLNNPTLLYHETTYLDDLANEAKKRGHSTARQAAEMAKLSEAGRLLTGHYSSRYKDDLEKFREETREVFPRTIINREGLIIDLNDNRIDY